MTEIPGKPMYKRLSISTAGSTMTITQTAKNLSEALNQELTYYENATKILAQVNISLDEEE